MTKTEMLTKLRILLSDAQEVGYPEDSELLDYLDRATVYYSEQMIAVKDPSMLKKMDVVGCLDLPNDFVALAGQHPVQITGRHLDYYGDIPYRVTYWANLVLPSSLALDSDVVPHTSAQDAIILELARVFALNRNEYDLTQDLTLNEVWQKAAKEARS